MPLPAQTYRDELSSTNAVIQADRFDLKNKGNILYVAPFDLSLTNGPGINEREFVAALYSAVGDRAHFIIPQPSKTLPDEIPQNCCTFSKPHRHYHPLHVIPHIVSQQRAIDAALAQRRYDMMIFRLGPLPISFLYTARRHQVPFVLRHLSAGLASIFNRRGGAIGRMLSRPNHYLLSQVARRAAMSDSVSMQDLHDVIVEYGVAEDRIVCIDNAVNTHRFFPTDVHKARAALGLAHFDPVVGYVGNYPWRRGAAQLIEAAPYLLRRFPRLGIVVLGTGSGMPALQQRANELGIAAHCVFTGQVPYEMVPQYVNALDLGVSILEPSEFAAAEQKVRQYLACGKPVVGTPGSNDFLATNSLGSVVDPENIPAIAQQLERWLRLDPESRLAFQQRALEYVDAHFSSGRMMSRRLELWSRMLNQRQVAAHSLAS